MNHSRRIANDDHRLDFVEGDTVEHPGGVGEYLLLADGAILVNKEVEDNDLAVGDRGKHGAAVGGPSHLADHVAQVVPEERVEILTYGYFRGERE